MRRLAGLHGRRRLRAARVLAVRRLGRGRPAGLAGAAVLVADEGGWRVFTLGGDRPVNPAEPVCHVSYYEADAFAHWQGSRLPTEAEWEAVAASQPVAGDLLDTTSLHPRPARPGLFGGCGVDPERVFAVPGLPGGARCGRRVQRQVHGQPVRTARGELRDARGHVRATYRNFFSARSRWAFSGLRLAADRDGRVSTRVASHEGTMRAVSDEDLRVDVHLGPEDFRAALEADVRSGLASTPKSIPPVWFYDEVGSALFEDITSLAEYYPTRAERALLEEHAPAIATIARPTPSSSSVRGRVRRPGCCSTPWWVRASSSAICLST